MRADSFSRLYVDRSEIADGDRSVRDTPLEDVIATAQEIMSPYKLDVKNVVWHSIYGGSPRRSSLRRPGLREGLQREILASSSPAMRVTPIAKAGQGMNVSMQDGFNLGWGNWVICYPGTAPSRCCAPTLSAGHRSPPDRV